MIKNITHFREEFVFCEEGKGCWCSLNNKPENFHPPLGNPRMCINLPTFNSAHISLGPSEFRNSYIRKIRTGKVFFQMFVFIFIQFSLRPKNASLQIGNPLNKKNKITILVTSVEFSQARKLLFIYSHSFCNVCNHKNFFSLENEITFLP